MIPRTIHNLGAHECISAMQKFIRRGMEREAMEMAVELGHTSKGFATWVTTRLEIISHEDVGLAAPEIIPLVRTCCEQARAWWNADKLGQWRMPIGTAIRRWPALPSRARAIISRPRLGSARSSKIFARRFPSGAMTSTRSGARPRAAASITSARSRPSSFRPRRSRTTMRAKRIGCGKSKQVLTPRPARASRRATRNNCSNHVSQGEVPCVPFSHYRNQPWLCSTF